MNIRQAKFRLFSRISQMGLSLFLLCCVVIPSSIADVTLTGRAYDYIDENAQPPKNKSDVTVIVKPNDGSETKSGLTGADGRYSIGGLPETPASLTAKLNGWKMDPKVQDVELKGETSKHDIELFKDGKHGQKEYGQKVAREMIRRITDEGATLEGESKKIFGSDLSKEVKDSVAEELIKGIPNNVLEGLEEFQDYLEMSLLGAEEVLTPRIDLSTSQPSIPADALSPSGGGGGLLIRLPSGEWIDLSSTDFQRFLRDRPSDFEEPVVDFGPP